MLLSRSNFQSKNLHFQDVYWHGWEQSQPGCTNKAWRWPWNFLDHVCPCQMHCWLDHYNYICLECIQQHTAGIWCRWFYYHLLLHTVPAQEQQISLPHCPAIEFSFKGLASLESCPLFPWRTANVQIITQKFCTGSGGAVNL
jgi:hypothetical protein